MEHILESDERVVATVRDEQSYNSLRQNYSGKQVLVAQVDVTNRAAVDACFEAAREEFGRIDIVINNAGYAINGEIEAASDDEARKQLEVVFWAPVYITKKVRQLF